MHVHTVRHVLLTLSLFLLFEVLGCETSNAKLYGCYVQRRSTYRNVAKKRLSQYDWSVVSFEGDAIGNVRVLPIFILFIQVDPIVFDKPMFLKRTAFGGDVFLYHLNVTSALSRSNDEVRFSNWPVAVLCSLLGMAATLLGIIVKAKLDLFLERKRNCWS